MLLTVADVAGACLVAGGCRQRDDPGGAKRAARPPTPALRGERPHVHFILFILSLASVSEDCKVDAGCWLPA